MRKPMPGQCPLCRAIIKIDPNLNTGETVFCTRCNAKLRIVSLNPVKLEALERRRI